MKTINRRLLFANCLLMAILALLTLQSNAQTIPVVKPELVAMSSERLKLLTETLDNYAAEERLAGGVAVVIRRGRIAYQHSFGFRDREANAKMTNDTIFRIASQTKAITSVGIMMLQEEGRLLISDPVSKYIPEFANTTVAEPKEGGGYDIVKAKRQITIRDLLTHTAGIGYGGGPAADKWKEAGITGWYFADRDEPVAETVKRMAALPMDAHPGERFVYGYATDILGVVIEKASGKSLDTFLSEKIFRPLKMNDTHFYLPQEKTARLAAVYAARTDGKIERSPAEGTMTAQGHYVKGPRKSYSGGAGLLSTPNDYGRFLLMLLNDGELDGQRILGRKSVELMAADHLWDIPYSSTGQGFGLGFAITKDVGARGVMSSVGEYGWGGAYHTNYWIDPKEDMIVLYFTQLIPAGNIDDYGKLRALVYQAITD